MFLFYTLSRKSSFRYVCHIYVWSKRWMNEKRNDVLELESSVFWNFDIDSVRRPVRFHV